MRLSITFESKRKDHLECIREWIGSAYEDWIRDGERPTKTTVLLDAVIYSEGSFIKRPPRQSPKEVT